MVARGTRRDYLVRHPEPADIALVVKVSDTTYQRDRYEKFPAFARAGIPVYWIVNLARRCIEVYTHPSPEGYATQEDHHAGDTVAVVIDGREVGRIAVDDILPPEPAADSNRA